MSRPARKTAKRDPLRITNADVKLLSQYAIDNLMREGEFDGDLIQLLMRTRHPDPKEFKRILKGRAACRREAEQTFFRIREINILRRIEASAKSARLRRMRAAKREGGAS